MIKFLAVIATAVIILVMLAAALAFIGFLLGIVTITIPIWFPVLIFIIAIIGVIKVALGK